MATATGTEAGTVLSDIAANAAEGFRRARRDAAAAAEKTVAVIRQSVSKGTYMLFYWLSFGTVYAAEVVLEFLPEDGVIRQGLRDGADAAREARAEHASIVSEVTEAAATWGPPRLHGSTKDVTPKRSEGPGRVCGAPRQRCRAARTARPLAHARGDNREEIYATPSGVRLRFSGRAQMACAEGSGRAAARRRVAALRRAVRERRAHADADDRGPRGPRRGAPLSRQDGADELMRLHYRTGRLVVRDVPFLGTPDAADFRLFVAVLFALEEVREIRIATKQCATEIFLDPSVATAAFARNLTARLKAKKKGAPLELPLRPDANGVVRIHRNGGAISTWRVASDVPGGLRVRNERLFRRKKLCHDVERELMTVIGVDRFKTSALGCSILIHYDTRRVGRNELIAVLDEILHEAEEHPHADAHKYEMLLCSGAVLLASATQPVAPALFIPAAILFIYCVIPTFTGAWHTLFVEHRLGVDVLDSIVVILCLLSGQLFAGTVLAWCLAFGRKLLERAQEDSRRRLVNVFAKQARSAFLLVDGTEVSVPLDRVKPGDLAAVHTGEVIPVDGTVLEGVAVVDQHALTGESVPVEKEAGSPVYASTLVVRGRLLVTA